MKDIYGCRVKSSLEIMIKAYEYFWLNDVLEIQFWFNDILFNYFWQIVVIFAIQKTRLLYSNMPKILIISLL